MLRIASSSAILIQGSMAISIPSRMLLIPCLIKCRALVWRFQFLLGCFICCIPLLTMNKYKNISIPSRMLPRYWWAFFRVCLLISIPSRMLQMKKHKFTNFNFMLFQFLLGCFHLHKVSGAHFPPLLFQFLLGCF